MKLDMKYIGKLAATLCATCAVVAGLLGLVNSVTAGPIEQINIENTNKALAAVFQGAAAPEFPEMEVSDEMKAAAASAEMGTLPSTPSQFAHSWKYSSTLLVQYASRPSARAAERAQIRTSSAQAKDFLTSSPLLHIGEARGICRPLPPLSFSSGRGNVKCRPGGARSRRRPGRAPSQIPAPL